MPFPVGLPPSHVHFFVGQLGGAPDEVPVATGLQFSMHHASLTSFLSSLLALQDLVGVVDSAGAVIFVPAMGFPPGHLHMSTGQKGVS